MTSRHKLLRIVEILSDIQYFMKWLQFREANTSKKQGKFTSVRTSYNELVNFQNALRKFFKSSTFWKTQGRRQTENLVSAGITRRALTQTKKRVFRSKEAQKNIRKTLGPSFQKLRLRVGGKASTRFPPD